ncbi:MAG: AAA family ATPase [Anaerolineaceae bacterium]|nr:AAA family ATPase [Anaerolineaceae bacterium]
MKLDVKNFRSIKDQSVELAPITVLYGPNGSGKSSLLYALLVMKNIILNPNRTTSNFFDLGFVNLGSFEALVHDHRSNEEILFQSETHRAFGVFNWGVRIGMQDGVFWLNMESTGSDPVALELPVSFPYRLDISTQQLMNYRELSANIIWDGINARPESAGTSDHDKESASTLASILNSPVEEMRNIGAVPLHRGFLRDSYSMAPVSPALVTEDEIATLLAHDRYLVARVSRYLERITGRELRVNFTPGTSIFTLDVAERSTGVGTEIVNDGFGVNQVAWLLARALHGKTNWICVEEPETHLHPSSIRELVKTLVEIMHDEQKRFLFTTHSEVFALAILSEVARGHLKPEDVTFYLTTKEGKETRFERQEINKHGQIEGGLTSFMEGELEDLAILYGETN